MGGEVGVEGFFISGQNCLCTIDQAFCYVQSIKWNSYVTHISLEKTAFCSHAKKGTSLTVPELCKTRIPPPCPCSYGTSHTPSPAPGMWSCPPPPPPQNPPHQTQTVRRPAKDKSGCVGATCGGVPGGWRSPPDPRGACGRSPVSPAR